jgi:hypothetical protein
MKRCRGNCLLGLADGVVESNVGATPNSLPDTGQLSWQEGVLWELVSKPQGGTPSEFRLRARSGDTGLRMLMSTTL